MFQKDIDQWLLNFPISRTSIFKDIGRRLQRETGAKKMYFVVCRLLHRIQKQFGFFLGHPRFPLSTLLRTVNRPTNLTVGLLLHIKRPVKIMFQVKALGFTSKRVSCLSTNGETQVLATKIFFFFFLLGMDC